jgi:hypothetical protein
VWRAALVILGVHSDGVLDQDPKHAWDNIRPIIYEDDKDKKHDDKISNIVREFDPVNAKYIGNKAVEARYTLAAGLSANIKSSVLMREGPVQILLLQWIVLCLWTHNMVRSHGLKNALSLLKRTDDQ